MVGGVCANETRSTSPSMRPTSASKSSPLLSGHETPASRVSPLHQSWSSSGVAEEELVEEQRRASATEWDHHRGVGEREVLRQALPDVEAPAYAERPVQRHGTEQHRRHGKVLDDDAGIITQPQSRPKIVQCAAGEVPVEFDAAEREDASLEGDVDIVEPADQPVDLGSGVPWGGDQGELVDGLGGDTEQRAGSDRDRLVRLEVDFALRHRSGTRSHA